MQKVQAVSTRVSFAMIMGQIFELSFANVPDTFIN